MYVLFSHMKQSINALTVLIENRYAQPSGLSSLRSLQVLSYRASIKKFTLLRV